MKMGAQELMPSFPSGKQADLNEIGGSHQEHQEYQGANIPLVTS